MQINNTILISPRLPFMQIRRLRQEGSYGIVGQIVNIPVDVDGMVKCLPRKLSDDATINVNIKKNLLHTSVYLSGYVNKGAVRAWLRYLVQQPLYKLYDIKTDFTDLDELPETREEDAVEEVDANNQPDSELIAARQSTVMWKHCEWHISLTFIQLLDMELYFGAMQLIVVRFLDYKRG
jgi:hypothetical protein